MRTSLLVILPLLLLAVMASAVDGQLDADLLKNLELAYANRGDQTALFNAIANNKLTDLTLNQE